jgi:uncharacterized protein HemX
MPDTPSENSDTPATQPEGTPQVDPSQPVADTPPSLSPPSATVEPFQSAGGPPPPVEAPKKRGGNVVFLVLLLLIIAAATGGYYYWSQGGSLPFLGAKSTPTPSPQASNTSANPDLDTAMQAADESLGDVDSNLANADTVLGDKQGDLSE